jgi:hypothetical protein
MQDWSSRVLAAEAKKAGRASEATQRIPSPPIFTGKDACIHRSFDGDVEDCTQAVPKEFVEFIQQHVPCAGAAS